MKGKAKLRMMAALVAVALVAVALVARGDNVVNNLDTTIDPTLETVTIPRAAR
jgi:Flp pilus assembly pilin Flp